MIDGSTLTASRTATCAAVAARHVANKDAEIVSVFGAGLIGRAHAYSKIDKNRISRRRRKYQ